MNCSTTDLSGAKSLQLCKGFLLHSHTFFYVTCLQVLIWFLYSSTQQQWYNIEKNRHLILQKLRDNLEHFSYVKSCKAYFWPSWLSCLFSFRPSWVQRALSKGAYGRFKAGHFIPIIEAKDTARYELSWSCFLSSDRIYTKMYWYYKTTLGAGAKWTNWKAVVKLSLLEIGEIANDIFESI